MLECVWFLLRKFGSTWSGNGFVIFFCCIDDEPRNNGNPDFKTFFFFVFCIILIHKGGTLMGINTLKIAVGETDCQVQKRNEVTWSRVYCMGSVVLVLNFYQRVQTRPKPSDFSGRKKILSTPSFGREVKPFVPCRRFTACYVEVGHFQAKFIGQFSPK